MDDLRKAKNRVLEAVVVAMDKDQHLPFGLRFGGRWRSTAPLRIHCRWGRWAQVSRNRSPGRREFGGAIQPGLSGAPGELKQQYRQSPIPGPRSPENISVWLIGPRARRRDQHLDLARTGRSDLGHRIEKASWGSAAGEAESRYGNGKQMLSARSPNAGREEATRPKGETTHARLSRYRCDQARIRGATSRQDRGWRLALGDAANLLERK